MACRKHPLSVLPSFPPVPVPALLLSLCLLSGPIPPACASPSGQETQCRPLPAPAGLSAPAFPLHPLQRLGLVRQSTAEEAPLLPPLPALPLALLPVPGLASGAVKDGLPAPPEGVLREARDRLAAVPAFPAAELWDLLEEAPAVRLAGTPYAGGALLAVFTRRDCPACAALSALLEDRAPELGFPVGLVPAGSPRQARAFYQARAVQAMPGKPACAPALPVRHGALDALDALARDQPERVRRFAEARLPSPRLPLLCWAANGRARLASLGARDVLVLLWLLRHDPDCF